MTASPYVDLSTVDGIGDGVHWTLATHGDLNANLVLLDPEHTIDAHTNNEVDVLLLVLAGGGCAVVDGIEHELYVEMYCCTYRGEQDGP